MTFRVVGRAKGMPQKTFPTFVLQQDRWDDHGFKTQYSLWFIDKAQDDSGLNQTHIGEVKILKLGQKESAGSLLTDDFDTLDEAYCSIGQSLDYYERLAELGQTRRDEALFGLRDIVKFPDFGESFRSEAGWNTSLFRNFSENDEFILLARSLLSGDYTSLPADDLQFSFQTTALEAPISFNFTAPNIPKFSGWLEEQNPMPSRISVLIGRNGSGKSTLLARLARVAHGSTSNRMTTPLNALGEIKPTGIGFPRIVTISYSAFDSFKLPGVTRIEQEQIVKDLDRGDGRFIFCGLRDIAEELRHELGETSQIELDQTDTAAVDQDRMHNTLLKPINKLADEFVQTLERIVQKNRRTLFDSALEDILSDSSFNELRGITLLGLQTNNPKDIFMSWSTGHKIVMQIVSSMAAHAEPRSLVLIDEPETHLHPPLLAALMHAIRNILAQTKAFAIVATHSPVVLQETLSRHVHVVCREGQSTTVRPLSIETFGENIGTVTSEVFGLNSEVTDFHKILDILVGSNISLNEIEDIFQEGGLSFQARAYVMSAIAAPQAESSK